MNQYTTLFEQQSYRDALDYYQQSLSSTSVPAWDYVILTASNDAQAKGYEEQLQYRKARHQLPSRTQFAVIPDWNGQRVGSGGATFSCIRYLAGQNIDAANPFAAKKILVIHSGGDSKRVPQYSACGKLFSPVPRLLPDARRSTLFDEFMIGMSTVASRITEGMLVCSGDVLLLFNALQIDFYNAGAAALSIKENVETGKNHGVYLRDADGCVGRFLHKQTVETLTDCGAVDSRGNVDIDTGAVILNAQVLQSLYSLIDTEEKYRAFVNEKARISFYADFLYPLASDATLEAYYKEKPEGNYTDELHACRTALWEALHPYRMRLIRLSPASFIHFGTTRELLHLMTDGMDEYRFLGWKSVINGNIQPEHYAISNSYVSREADVGAGSYVEDSRILAGSRVGIGCIISGVTLKGETVPDHAVLHGLKLNDGRFVVRMYGVNDNPKESRLFGQKLEETLWTASLFPVCDTITEAVSATLQFAQEGFRNTDHAPCLSLKDSFNQADVTAILPWQENLQEQVVAEAILEMIQRGVPAEEARCQYPTLHPHSVDYLLDRAKQLHVQELDEFRTLIRIYAYLWKITGDVTMADRCFQTIGEATLLASENGTHYNPDLRLLQDATVQLPVRVNWGGGWSDTPPYCMENGGTVLNAAISLNGKLPIEVTVRLEERPIFALSSTDIGSYHEFTDICELQDCRNPSDPFALHKAALIACGIIPQHQTVPLEEICRNLGGDKACGLFLNTRVLGIPKGSGLGTSSILAGACVKALLQAMDVEFSDDEVFQRVLCMEQLMSTGGGWQDQVGGIAPGIKMITTQPGLNQTISCVKCSISVKTIDELNERFTVIYTGQRRLARNLLRDVVSRYICNDPTSLEAHYAIQRLAVLMRFELEKGNVDGFAHLLSEHWQESQRIDAGSTNTCIDQVFMSIDDLIDGKMICGAGGGGFLQVVLKKGITKQRLRERLNEVFQDSGVDVWDCAFI